MKPTFWMIAAVALAFVTTCSQSAVYELKRNGTACIIVNSTLIVRVAYLNTKGKTAIASWTLGKSVETVGRCDFETEGRRWSELTLNASGASLGLRFVNSGGRVHLANASLTVDIINGTRFINPASSGLVTLTARPNMSLCSDTEHFVCHSSIKLPLIGSANGSDVSFMGTVVQAFNLTGGRLSNASAECPQDAGTSTTATTSTDTTATTSAGTNVTTSAGTTVRPTAAPTTRPSPSSDPPLLNLTVFDNGTDIACLFLQARIQFTVPYQRADSVGVATVTMRKDAVARGDCASANDSTNAAAREQTLEVEFFANWWLTMRLTLSGSEYALTGIRLDYNVNNTAIFPGATNVGKELTASGNKTYFGRVPNNGYYACNLVNFTLEGERKVSLAMRDLSMQAFRRDKGPAEFTGARLDCISNGVSHLVPIVVGTSLAALVILVLVAYLIGRRRQSSRNGYQSV